MVLYIYFVCMIKQSWVQLKVHYYCFHNLCLTLQKLKNCLLKPIICNIMYRLKVTIIGMHPSNVWFSYIIELFGLWLSSRSIQWTSVHVAVFRSICLSLHSTKLNNSVRKCLQPQSFLQHIQDNIFKFTISHST